MKKPTSLSTLMISRHGLINVRTTGAHHCGTSDLLQIRYQFTAKCNADNLDERGFLFDQTRVDQFMQSVKSTDKSCEVLALTLARALFKLVRSENGKCDPLSLKLELSPAPFVAVLTFEWTK